MTRIRSPNYPAISLPSAIERVSNCYSLIGESAAAHPEFAKALGFGSVNGSALSAIGAMRKYGLIRIAVSKERLPGFAIADRAVSILRPKDNREKAQAIWDAATAPDIFVDLIDHFQGIIPEQSDIATYLQRRGFGEAALGPVSQAFRETFALVLAEAHGYNPPITNAAGKSPEKRISSAAHLPLEIAPQLETDKMRVTVTETGVEVNATLTTREGIDRLMRTLEATRPLVNGIVPQEGSSKEEPGLGQPRL